MVQPDRGVHVSVLIFVHVCRDVCGGVCGWGVVGIQQGKELAGQILRNWKVVRENVLHQFHFFPLCYAVCSPNVPGVCISSYKYSHWILVCCTQILECSGSF